jgi:hypothetical protein
LTLADSAVGRHGTCHKVTLLPQPLLLLLLLLTFPPCLLCCSYIAKRLCQASGKPMGSCFSDQMMMTIIFVSHQGCM